jgi:hypothetical protein
MPAGEGGFGHWRGDTAAGSEGVRGSRPERRFHAQGFGDGRDGNAVLAAVWSHDEIVAAGRDAALRARTAAAAAANCPGGIALSTRATGLGKDIRAANSLVGITRLISEAQSGATLNHHRWTKGEGRSKPHGFSPTGPTGSPFIHTVRIEKRFLEALMAGPGKKPAGLK